MCTVVVLFRPGHDWPLLFAANRDEMAGRPWRAPGRHWPTHPDVVGGLDELAGGTWMGLNGKGVVAAILNRPGTLGPKAGFASRGDLPLMALDHATAAEAAAGLGGRDASLWRPFNLLLADSTAAFWARWDGMDLGVQAIPPGLAMLTAHDLNDTAASVRMRRYRPRFEAASVPDPERGDWRSWQDLLASRETDGGPHGAMTVAMADGFGTVCSSLLGLPAKGAPVWLFSAGRPGEVPWREVGIADDPLHAVPSILGRREG
ncbi:MAG: NRDE family protein [Magnetospirillum sp. WYHS-4]